MSEAHPDDQDRELRDFTSNLFGRTEPEPETDRRQGNVVPREGAVTRPGPSGEAVTREWARELFGHPGMEFV